jgi:hypothetical protein
MRGAPWIRFLLMATSLALAGLPIWLLRRTDVTAPPPVPPLQSEPAERELTLAIETAPSAEAIGASYLGRELIPLTHAGGAFSGTIRLPAGSAWDLVVTARWTGSEPAALRVRASDENGFLTEASFWGTGKIQEVLTVPEVRQ